MEGLAQWVQNLVFYFIFLSAIMNFLPGGDEKKYVRFFMGMLLLLLLLNPLLQFSGFGHRLEGEVLADVMEESFSEMMQGAKIQKAAGKDYVKHACEREVKVQLEEMMELEGYEIKSSSVSFFDGEELKLERISLRLKMSREEEKLSKGEQEKMIKNKLNEVYNIPEGNINISIQG